MKAENWPQLVGELTDHMANVRRVFNELIGDDEADTPQEEERSERGVKYGRMRYRRMIRRQCWRI